MNTFATKAGKVKTAVRADRAGVVYEAARGKIFERRGFKTRAEAEQALKLRKGWRVEGWSVPHVTECHYRIVPLLGVKPRLQGVDACGDERSFTVHATKRSALRAALKVARASEKLAAKEWRARAKSVARLAAELRGVGK